MYMKGSTYGSKPDQGLRCSVFVSIAISQFVVVNCWFPLRSSAQDKYLIRRG